MKIMWIFIAFAIFIVVLAGSYGSQGYLKGKYFHYMGTSEITPEQLAQIITEHTVGLEGQISAVELLESGLVKITYDFYDSEVYEFLPQRPYAFSEIPLIHNVVMADWWEPVKMLLACGLLFPFLYFLFKSRKFAWYVMHPVAIFKHQNPPETLFTPVFNDDIKIDANKSGIIGIRTWMYKNKDGYLYSLGVGQMCWNSKVMYANKKPQEGNENGCYAFRLGCLQRYSEVKKIIGIVSLAGEYIEHADGVLRGESCEIVHLLLDKSNAKIADKLSSFYGVPVTITDNTINTYCKWITSENGLKCLQHNMNILKEVQNGNERTYNQERAVANAV